MYLKRLELQGFKSFADKTVLEFMPGITTVIGPNGSGKSNISDSIRWVLGEQSIKSLRGAKSLDIIFAGTENRKSLGFAEASLIFDNTDGTLPIEYQEVVVTRKIYRSGETGYYINKTPCRLKDVIELFMDTGIGRDGYSIIGQGKIDEILSNKSEDRRHIFEEAAGIVKYRARKEETEKKVEHTKLNLLRINDILSEIEQNLEPLRIQSDKAKQFLNLREELKNIEIGLFLYNIEKYKEELQKIAEDEEIMKDTLNQEEGRLERINSLKEELKTQIDEITTKIEEAQNIGFESKSEIEKANSEINVAQTKIQNNNENNTRYEDDIKEYKQRIKDLKEEIEQKKSRKDNLKKNKEKFETELKEKEAELTRVTSKLTEKELQYEDKKKIVEGNTEKKYELQTQIGTDKANLENLNKRKDQLKQEISNNISDLDGTRMKKEEITKEFQKIESEKNKITKEIEQISRKREEANKKIEQFEDEINILSNEMRIKDSRLKFLMETEREKEGYTKSVKELLKACERTKELGKGIHGVLANIITVPKEYETAIEMCLGASLQNVVTDTEEDARRLIEYLKTNNLGRASFLPLTSIKGKKLERIRSHANGIIGIASDLIQYDKKYEHIILNLLGRTVIVDNMQTAIALARTENYAYRIITLQGDLINPSGLITGGSVAKKTVNILGRSREIESLEQEVKQLREKIAKTEKAKQDYISSNEDIIEHTESLEKMLQEIDITYATGRQRVISIEENVERLASRLAKSREEVAEIEKQITEVEEQRSKKEEKITELTSKNNSLVEEINKFAEANKEEQKYIDDLNFDITNLKISVSSFDESESSIIEMEERIKQDIQNNENSLNIKEQQIEQIKSDNIKLEQGIENLKNRIKDIEEKVQNSGKTIEELRKQRQEKNEKLSKKEEEQVTQFKMIEDLKAQNIKIEVKKNKIEEDCNGVINKMWEEYELTPNAVTDYKKPENVANTQRRVNNLRADINNLGSVNIDSIKEYENLKSRYDFMCEQRLDLENTMAKLQEVIQDMTKTMKEQFKQQFEIINKNFGEVFRELFGGGKAEVILTDENNILECGIDIEVQPPGKKLQNMLLLSGGERAFTAIALLFAILKINPAPFCVLDEIEAALDDVNVYRYADYLKKFAKDTQFLIITHRKGTMEAADTVYGVTMEEKGISKLLSMKLK